MYADQVKDSVHIFYADAWTGILNESSWLTMTPNSGEVERGAMLMVAPIYFTAEPNTTGHVRFANLIVRSHEDGALTITQLPVLNIVYPYYQFKQGNEISSDNIEYVAYYAATATEGEIRFVVYRDDATLTSDQAWCQPERTTFEAGEYTLKLTLLPNPSTEIRTATLTLTSGGVSTPITIVQTSGEDD